VAGDVLSLAQFAKALMKSNSSFTRVGSALLIAALALLTLALSVGGARAGRDSGARLAQRRVARAAVGPAGFAIISETLTYTTPLLITDLRYSDRESFDIHRLTIFRPESGAVGGALRPVIFFIHGGGWVDGYRDWYDWVAEVFTGEKGWVTVVIDYRLTSDQVFVADQYCPDRATCSLPQNVPLRTKAAEYPDNIADVAAAFRWTSAHIGEFGGDPRNLFVFGHSAGAHLASLLGTADAYADLRPHIRGLIAMSGVYRLTDASFKLLYSNILTQTFGTPLNNTELSAASPAELIHPGAAYPALQLLYCEGDLPLFPAQTTAMTNVLTANAIPYRLDYLPGYTHVSEMTAIQAASELPTVRIIEFIESLLHYPVWLPLVLR
jgi:acetyl esterase/lipase